MKTDQSKPPEPKLPQLPDNPSQTDILSFFMDITVIWSSLKEEQKQALLKHFHLKTKGLQP